MTTFEQGAIIRANQNIIDESEQVAARGRQGKVARIIKSKTSEDKIVIHWSDTSEEMTVNPGDIVLAEDFVSDATYQREIDHLAKRNSETSQSIEDLQDELEAQEAEHAETMARLVAEKEVIRADNDRLQELLIETRRKSNEFKAMAEAWHDTARLFRDGLQAVIETLNIAGTDPIGGWFIPPEYQRPFVCKDTRTLREGVYLALATMPEINPGGVMHFKASECVRVNIQELPTVKVDEESAA